MHYSFIWDYGMNMWIQLLEFTLCDAVTLLIYVLPSVTELSKLEFMDKWGNYIPYTFIIHIWIISMA